MDIEYRFEWDLRKAESNLRKHGISFDDARLVFADPLKKIDIQGYDHGEIRWRAIGEIDGNKLAVVIHTSREEGEEGAIEVIRVISARRATSRERALYTETP
ncbi:MAG TPA: BrnT family toxin [Rhizomicrobium sp.]|nr:BrnT family toxin [Rhizomicrobium sp.]